MNSNAVGHITNTLTALPAHAHHLMVQICTNGAICNWLETDEVSALMFSVTLIIGFLCFVGPVAGWGQIKEWVKQAEGE